MPPLIRYSSTAVDAQTDAICALLNDGYLQIYDGDQPSDGDAATDGTLLVELRFADPAFQASVNGIAWANAIATATATQTGQAKYLRTLRSDHTEVVFDGNIANTGAT